MENLANRTLLPLTPENILLLQIQSRHLIEEQCDQGRKELVPRTAYKYTYPSELDFAKRLLETSKCQSLFRKASDASRKIWQIPRQFSASNGKYEAKPSWNCIKSEKD